MTIYNVVMESIYYDGDDYTFSESAVEIHSCSTLEKAKEIMEKAIRDEIDDGNYTEDMLISFGSESASFADKVNGNLRFHYNLSIEARELEA